MNFTAFGTYVRNIFKYSFQKYNRQTIRCYRMDDNGQDDNEVWTPPESTQEHYPISYDPQRVGESSSYQSNVVYSSSTLTFPTSSTQNAQSYNSQYVPQEYHHPDSAR
jgi:hypothetical protein